MNLFVKSFELTVMEVGVIGMIVQRLAGVGLKLENFPSLLKPRTVAKSVQILQKIKAATPKDVQVFRSTFRNLF